MFRFIIKILLGIIISCYFFPFSFTFLPESINTKMMLAAVGIPILIYNTIRYKFNTLPMGLVGATALAVIFSVACLFSCIYNNTSDYAYATYITSFITWLLGAYTTVTLIRLVHGRVSIALLTEYLAAVCAAQCISAIIIDQNAVVKMAVNLIVSQGTDFLEQVKRLYGIGASLDPAGTRFSITLMLIAATLTNTHVKKSTAKIVLLLLAYFIIAMLGNIISRTTSVGFLISLFIFIFSSGVFRLVMHWSHVRLYGILLVMLTIAVFLFFYLYNTNPYFHDQLRYGFEGLFNWLETGVWRTDSTDKLNDVMWVWPTDTQTWLIGSGHFSDFYFSTDIGYCRFILYCGLTGFSIYALFFIYQPVIFMGKFRQYRLLLFGLMALSFIIWVKVATDIFLIYALFFCITRHEETEEDLATTTGGAGS